MLDPMELLKLPDYMLKAIYHQLNFWMWPEVLGEKPEGWDEMLNYRRSYMDEQITTKEDIIRPYMAVIKTRVSHWDVYPIYQV